MSASHRPRPIALIVLDGWGYSEETEYNSIAQAKTPSWDKLWANYPHTLLRASGAEVGLPTGQMGNSEVGHLHLGAGRVIYQEFTRISRSIKTGSFFSNQTLTDAADLAVKNGSALHIFGLLSPGGVHSHEEHIHAMAELAVNRGVPRVYVHGFLDGRDTPPKSAGESLRLMDEKFRSLGRGRVASICGRFYAMDRDNRWPRVEAAYQMLTSGSAEFTAPDTATALLQAYERGETDEFVKPTLIVPQGEEAVRIVDGDVVVFMNYRSDRARELTRAFIDPQFSGFSRQVVPQLASYVSLTEYSGDFDIPVAFPPERLRNIFGEYVSRLGMHQLRIAETEKYAHVTFFFNGGVETPFEWEERILVPSPKVTTYDEQPRMSAGEVTDKLVAAIESGTFDFIICNFANPDMVGHTGNFEATVEAIEFLDECLGRVWAAMQRVGGEMLITADHGNAELMRGRDTGQAHTAHTTNLVPFIYVGRPAEPALNNGTLIDVAPTLLYLAGIDKPTEMIGQPLVHLVEEVQPA